MSPRHVAFDDVHYLPHFILLALEIVKKNIRDTFQNTTTHMAYKHISESVQWI